MVGRSKKKAEAQFVFNDKVQVNRVSNASSFSLLDSASLETNLIHCGDCSSILRSLPENSIDTVITSPPYFQQRDYTGIGVGMESSVTFYLEALLDSFLELVRVIKPSGSIIYNIGDKIDRNKGTMLIPYRFAMVMLETIPSLSLLNEITWIKKNPTPRQFSKRLVSATEPFFHFVKSSEYFYDVDNYMVSDSPPKQHKPTDKLGSRYFELIEESDLSKEERENARIAVREAIEDVNAGEIIGFRMKIRGQHSPAFGGQNGGRKIQMERNGFTVIRILGKPIKKDYISSAVESRRGIDHPAMFPLSLIEEFVKLTCPDGGIVLDPYCGSGTTLLAARRQNKQYIGIDINPKYCSISRERLQDE